MRLQIEFQSTQEQFSEVARELRRLMYRNHSEQLIKRFTPAILLVLVLLLLNANRELTAFVAGAVALYAWLWFWSYWRYAKNTMAGWEPDQNTWCVHRAVITDEEIQLRTAEIETVYHWPAFKSWSDSENYIILWQASYALLALPKRAFDSQQREEFIKFIASANLPQI